MSNFVVYPSADMTQEQLEKLVECLRPMMGVVDSFSVERAIDFHATSDQEQA